MLATLRIAWLQAQPDGVCARVGLRLDQSAVMTRTAFRATLEISNNDPVSALTSVSAQVVIRDALGNLANDRFRIETPSLENVDDIDGTGMMPAGRTATIRWLLIPAEDAAPSRMTEYSVGGQFGYNLGEIVAKVPLEPVKIEVYPDAALDLTYFHQRNVFSDDPFTPEVEPALPYALAVMVKNRGAGAAKSLKITSGEPQIVSNDKGLLADFKLIGARINGTNAPGTMALDFGRIEPEGVKIAEWYFTSSLQGFFQNFSATFQHEDNLGDIRLSTIKNVSIRELIQIVEAGSTVADGQLDFLVNDVPDPENLPDALYLSDGRVLPVQAVQLRTLDGSPSATDLEVTLTAPMPSGWAYLRVPEPSNGQLKLTRVRRSDGMDIPVGTNVWTTDRTFTAPGQRPLKENVLHLLDLNSPGEYTLYYMLPTEADSAAPESLVAALPPTSHSHIPVTWTGVDDSGGSGVAFFDIFVSTDGGPLQPWLTGTTLRGAIYPGAFGSRYAFVSAATDAAGNREVLHGAPDAETIVSLENTAPVLAAIPSITMDEGETLALTCPATDADVPPDLLTFRLAPGAPTGLTIDPVTGGMTWATGENHGPGTNVVTVRVTDNGSPNLSDEKSFTIVVREVNRAPTLEQIPNLTATEGFLASYLPAASDFDSPANALTFELAPGAPEGAIVHPKTGLFTWPPSEIQGGTTNFLRLTVTDEGGLRATRLFTVIVLEHNSTPVITPVPQQTILPGGELIWIVQATDPDIPTNNLAFSLGTGAPAGATIDPISGRLTWRPSASQPPGNYTIPIVVTDDGIPSASATQSLTVVIPGPASDFAIGLGSTNVLAGQSAEVDLRLSAERAVTNVSFVLEVPEDRLTNIVFVSGFPGVLAGSVESAGPNRSRLRLNTTNATILRGALTAGRIRFLAASNDHSAVLPLRVLDVVGITAAGVPLASGAAIDGQLIIIGREPVLTISGSPLRKLTLFGRPWSSYAVESAPTVTGPWTLLQRVPVTTQATDLEVPEAINGTVFYRANAFEAFPPILEVTSSRNATLNLLLYGESPGQYDLESTGDLGDKSSWIRLMDIRMTNSFRFLDGLDQTNRWNFFRVRKQ